MKEVTYEEMAEKYAKGLCKTCKVDVCRYSKIQTCVTKESLKQAYLAGAEFGYNKCNERLIKAKNLLTRLIMGSVYFNGKETDLVEEAEQFLRKGE